MKNESKVHFTASRRKLSILFFFFVIYIQTNKNVSKYYVREEKVKFVVNQMQL